MYGVHRTCAETAAVSCGTSHASAVSTPLRWIFKKKKKNAIYIYIYRHICRPDQCRTWCSIQQAHLLPTHTTAGLGWWSFSKHIICRPIVEVRVVCCSASRQVCVATRKRIMLELRHAICNLLLQCVLCAAGASRQVCVATRKRITLELQTSFATLSLHVVYHRCKSPGVCGDQKEDHVGVALVICRSINAECCLPQVQVARRMWRPERGLCWSYTRHFPPYHCRACCLTQVHVASVFRRRCKSPGVFCCRCKSPGVFCCRCKSPVFFQLQVQVARCFQLQVQVARCFLLQVQVATCV